MIRRAQCSVVLIFNYKTGVVEVEFGSGLHRRNLEPNIQTDTTVLTVIHLEDPQFMENTIEYGCSTSDQCDLDYVQKIALPSYASPSCENFRSKLLQNLHPSSSSKNRECFQEDNSTKLCAFPCDFSYGGPNQVSHTCSNQNDLSFQTFVGFSEPFNKPEYYYRRLSYGCTPQLCNGIVMQHHIEKLIAADDGGCMTFFNRSTSTTTASTSSTTGNRTNHGETFSKAFTLMIFLVFLPVTFF